MLDLEEGAIAWAGSDDPSIINMALFRGGARWYASWPYTRGTLAVFDGNSGLVAAVRAQSPDGVDEIEPFHVAGDRIWLHGQDWRAAAAPTLAVLDAATLVPTFSRRIEIVDVTAAERASLGSK